MPSDLLLLAVRYLSNELPADEQAAFENRLAEDQSAREALAQAVEISLAVSNILPARRDGLPMPRGRGWLYPVRLGVAAASVVLAVGLSLLLIHSQNSVRRTAPAVAELEPSESVVLVWSGLRQGGEIESSSPAEHLAWLDEPLVLSSLDRPAIGPSAIDDELLPRWLIEATSLNDSSSSPEDVRREN